MNNPATTYIMMVAMVTIHIAGSIASTRLVLPSSLCVATVRCNISVIAVSRITVRYIMMYDILSPVCVRGDSIVEAPSLWVCWLLDELYHEVLNSVSSVVFGGYFCVDY